MENGELKMDNRTSNSMKFRYRTDEEMKDSGVEWIGEIPKYWNVTKFKFVSELYTGNSIKDNEKDNYLDSKESYPYIATKDIDINYNKVNYLNGMYTKFSDKSFKVARENNILLCIEGGSAGRKITYLDRDVTFVNKLCCISSNKINSKFQYYYCNSNSFFKEFHLNLSGLIGGVSVGILKNFNIIRPNINEQEKIVKFLDVKTAEFDYIISKKEALIEKLEEAKKSIISEVVTGKVKVVKTEEGYQLIKRKTEEMKDSGVEWLGDIPKSWQVKAIKYLFKLRNERNIKEMENVQLLSLFTEFGVLKQGEVEARGNKVRTVEDYKEVYPNDIVVNIILAWMGAIGMSDYRGVISPAYDIYEPINEQINSKFYHYLFRTRRFSGECYKKGRGIMDMRWRTYSDEFKSILVPITSIEENNTIVSFLNERINSINKLIEKSNKQIEKLKEAKQSLISEAVTGKIEVLD